jgi:hypothetical protein
MENFFGKVSVTRASATMLLPDSTVFSTLPSFTVMPALMAEKFFRMSRVFFEMVIELVFVVVIIKISLSCVVVFHISLQVFFSIVTAAALVLAISTLSRLLCGRVTAVVVKTVFH